MDFRDTQLNPSSEDSFAPAATRGNKANLPTQDTSNEYADEYPAYIRLTRDIPAATSFNLGDEELRHMPYGSQESGWQNCLNAVEKYDRELCQAYREQIDTLLVFAGLFSAVVTAFAVESYQWLQDDPMDTSVQLLRDVVSLLSETSNLTAPTIPMPAQRLSGAAIVRINSFWFLSLALSLAAALVGILCKQWLREFERNVGQSPERALAVRYIRFHGLEYWKVGTIVTSVPIIMQIALAFFIIGIVELLWHLHVIVACCVTVTAGLTLAFYLATTLLPVMQNVYVCMRCCVQSLRTHEYASTQAFTEPQCAFKSAQAWLAFRFCWPLISYILKSYGFHFSTYHPPVFSEHILRPLDSWIDFDLNWVKSRENVHMGPGCAFESLSWISTNLGELHMNSWIWHCVWARSLMNREFSEDFSAAATDVESVARSYPRMVSLGNDLPPLARLQAHIFRCSARSDLPIDTALELVLRVTAVSGPCSEWTRDALHLVRVIYRGQFIRLSDDVAIALFHLSKLQVHAIIHAADGPNSATQYNAAVSFSDIAMILHRGTHLRDVFIPAMAGFVLQWLRSRSPRPIARHAYGVFHGMVQCLVLKGCRGAAIRDLRQRRGIMFISKLAGAVVRLWPETLRFYDSHSDEHAVILELLDILSDGFLHDVSGARVQPPQEQVASADEELSPAPAAADADGRVRETHADPPDGRSYIVETPPPESHAHLCIDMHGEAETDAAMTEVSVNGPASPVANPVPPASPPRSPRSRDMSGSPAG